MLEGSCARQADTTNSSLLFGSTAMERERESDFHDVGNCHCHTASWSDAAVSYYAIFQRLGCRPAPLLLSPFPLDLSFIVHSSLVTQKTQHPFARTGLLDAMLWPTRHIHTERSLRTQRVQASYTPHTPHVEALPHETGSAVRAVWRWVHRYIASNKRHRCVNIGLQAQHLPAYKCSVRFLCGKGGRHICG